MSDDIVMLKIQKIPDRDVESLTKLAGMADGAFAQLVEVCRSAKPCLGMRKFLDGITALLPTDAQDAAKAMLESLFGMQVARIRVGVIADEFVEAVLSAQNVRELKLPDEKLEVFRGRLGQMLAVDSLFIAAKAASVLTAHEHPFESARIFTDVRPIFGDAKAEEIKPQAAVLVHMLKLTLAGEETEREFYVAMDNRDLQTLIDALTRAKGKAAELREFVQRGGLSYLEP